MRPIGFAALGVALAATTAAQAQVGGRKPPRGNESQQQTGRSNVPQAQEKRFPLGSNWIAVTMNGKPFAGTERPSFTVAENFRLSGFGGCNSFSATAYPLKEQGIAVGPLALTKRNCDAGVMASEKAFLVALRTAAKWDSVTGTLTVRGPNGELKFERAL